MRSQRFLNWVCCLVLVAFGASNLMGCGVLALSVKVGPKKIVGTQIWETKEVVKKDVEMVLVPKEDELIGHLQYKPHYQAQIRSVKKAELGGGTALLMLAAGLVETFFLLGYAVQYTTVDSLKKAGIRTKAETDAETNESLWLYDSDLNTKPWADQAALGVIADIVTWYYLADDIGLGKNESKSKSFTPWQPSGTVLGSPEPIPNHLVSISLPQFQYQSMYYTNAAGEFTIPVLDLIGKISNLAPVLDDKRVEVEASAKVDGQREFATFMITPRTSGSLFQAFADEADYRGKALPAELLTEVVFSDAGAFMPNNILDAGEQNGKLQITVHNKGQGPGLSVQLHLSTDHPGVQLAEQTRSLGYIEPNGKKTVVVPITTSLQATDGVANIRVEAKEVRGYDARKRVHRLPVARFQPPSLAITKVEINDHALGNGNGLVENSETIEFNVFIHNGGPGDALDARLELADINQGIDVQVQSAHLGIIRPQQTVQGLLRFHVPRTFAASVLECQLRVSALRVEGELQTKRYPVKQLAPRLDVAYRLVGDGNGDGKIQQGERIEFELTVSNNGSLDALNLRLTVSASDSRIRITPLERRLGELVSGGSSSPQRFTFILPRAVPAGELSLVAEVVHEGFSTVDRSFNFVVYEEEIAVTR